MQHRFAAKDAADAYSQTVKVPALAARPPVLSVGVPAKADLKFFGDTSM